MKAYRFQSYLGSLGEMEEDDNGAWVQREDVAALEARLAAAEALLDETLSYPFSARLRDSIEAFLAGQ
jgi:hypothetical protein